MFTAANDAIARRLSRLTGALSAMAASIAVVAMLVSQQTSGASTTIIAPVHAWERAALRLNAETDSAAQDASPEEQLARELTSGGADRE